MAVFPSLSENATSEATKKVPVHDARDAKFVQILIQTDDLARAVQIVVPSADPAYAFRLYYFDTEPHVFKNLLVAHFGSVVDSH